MAKENDSVHNKLIQPIKLRRYSKSGNPLVVKPNISPKQIQPARTLKPRNIPSIIYRNRETPQSARPKQIMPAVKITRNANKQIKVQNRGAEMKFAGAKGIDVGALEAWKIKESGISKVAVIIGNGPSAAYAPLDLLKSRDKIDIISINKPDARVWPSKYWLFCDNSQYRRHVELWNAYNGTIINATSVTHNRQNAMRVKCRSGKGFSRDIINGFYIGRSSVYAALQVAMWLEYDDIYVFGLDMCAVDGKLYPWGSNPDVNDDTRAKRFKLEAEHYDWASKNLSDAERAKIHICSKFNTWPFMEKFERLDETLAVDVILAKINKK